MEMNFKQIKTVKTGINSALDLNPENNLVASLSRADSKKSSKFTYTLQVYKFPSLQQYAKKDIYDTYSQGKHFIKFMLDRSNPKIAVVTQYHIYIFNLNKELSLSKQILHKQLDIYDFSLSNDGKYMLLVGDKINIWRLNDYHQIIFPSIIPAAHYSQFSRDNKYLGICSNNQIYIFNYDNTLNFKQITTKSVPAQKGDITSFDFNPVNSNQIALGYVNSNPDFFSIQKGQFFKNTIGTQPSQKQNPKIVKILPDGKRMLSSDFINGVGLWPGINNKLYYKEKFLIYGIKSDNIGSKFAGFVWQSLKIIQIQLDCGGSNFLPQCQCRQNQIWNYSSYNCQNLNCGINFSTGNIIKDNNKNICQCIQGYVFNPVTKKCQINCTGIQNSLLLLSDDKISCQCDLSYKWNSSSRICDFSCQNTQFSTKQLKNNNGILQCQCKQGFLWNSIQKSCQCPSFMRQNLGKCQCLQTYKLNPETNKCQIDCSLILNANQTANINATNLQYCICNKNYQFIIIDNVPGCRVDCRIIKNALPDAIGFNFCLCQEKTRWNFDSFTCQIQCQQIPFAVPIPNDFTKCQCAVNYVWHQSINECGKICQGIPNLNSSEVSTIRRCPCINHFQWMEQKNRCQVDCASLNFTTPYPLPDYTKCQCNNAFYWDSQDYKCMINCSQIWKADQRISDGQCSCLDNLKFNHTLFNCQSEIVGQLFDNWWMIVVLVFSALAVLIISIVLIRFCWKFSIQEKSKQEQNKKKNQNKTKNIRKKIFDAAYQKNSQKGYGTMQSNGENVFKQFNYNISNNNDNNDDILTSQRFRLSQKITDQNLGVQVKKGQVQTQNMLKQEKNQNMQKVEKKLNLNNLIINQQ